MRNGQQKRMRGRNNNRRSSNPLTRVYESNGPDVKVRGTAHHVAEKYQQLARDAQASGDPVAAENYFQHAEHYLRLIASLQGQFAPPPGFGRDDEMDDEDMDDVGALDAPQPFPRGEQPYAAREDRGPREDRGSRDDRGPREDRGPRDDRGPREPRGEDRGQRDNRQNNFRRNRDEDGEGGYQPREQREPREPRGEQREPREFRRRNRDDANGEGFVPRAARASRGDDGEQPRAPRPVQPPAVPDADIGLPSFITGTPAVAKERVTERVTERAAERPVERPVEPVAERPVERAPEPVAAAPDVPREDAAEAAEGADARRGRRRRFRTRADRAEDGAPEAGAEPPAQPVLFNE